MLQLLKICWRVVGLTGKPIVCGIYTDDRPGVELRVGYTLSDVLKAQRIANVETAEQMAEQWRRTALADGFADMSRRPTA
jgi:hypothetical protein